MDDPAFEPVWIDFSEMGAPGYWPVTRIELDILYKGAEGIIREHDAEAIEDMIHKTKQQLRVTARRRGINPDWISTATMVTALAGIRGHKVPDFRHHDK